MNDYIPDEVSTSVMLSSTEVNQYVDADYRPEVRPEARKMNGKISYYCVRMIPIMLLEILLIINMICDYELCGISSDVHSLELSQKSRISSISSFQFDGTHVLPSYFNAQADLLYIVKRERPSELPALKSDIFPAIIMFNYTKLANYSYHLSELTFEQNAAAAIQLDFINPKRRKVELLTPSFDFSYWKPYVGETSSYTCGGKALQTNLSINGSLDFNSNMPLWWINLDPFLTPRGTQCNSNYQLNAYVSSSFCIDAMIFRQLETQKIVFNTSIFEGNLILDFDLLQNSPITIELNFSQVQEILLTKAPGMIYFKAVSSTVVFALPALDSPCKISPEEAAYNSTGICKVNVYGTLYSEEGDKEYEDRRVEVTEPLEYGDNAEFVIADELGQCVWNEQASGSFQCLNSLFAVAEVSVSAGWLCSIISLGKRGALECECSNCQ